MGQRKLVGNELSDLNSDIGKRRSAAGAIALVTADLRGEARRLAPDANAGTLLTLGSGHRDFYGVKRDFTP